MDGPTLDTLVSAFLECVVGMGIVAEQLLCDSFDELCRSHERGTEKERCCRRLLSHRALIPGSLISRLRDVERLLGARRRRLGPHIQDGQDNGTDTQNPTTSRRSTDHG